MLDLQISTPTNDVGLGGLPDQIVIGKILQACLDAANVTGTDSVTLVPRYANFAFNSEVTFPLIANEHFPELELIFQYTGLTTEQHHKVVVEAEEDYYESLDDDKVINVLLDPDDPEADELDGITKIAKTPSREIRIYATQDRKFLMQAEYSDNTAYHTYLLASLNGSHNLEEIAARIVEHFPGLTPPDSDSVSVTFWADNGPYGPKSYVRSLKTHRWEAVNVNYQTDVANHLEKMAKWTSEDFDSGSLMLLHGPPGTGKTNIIRTLIREWKSWCDVEYIMDPEKFFGQASYMSSVVLGSNSNRWRILIVEDANELIGKDAKKQTGQGVSRLLNLCDGLIGQGINIIVLITTNEDISQLHPAIIRKGRCRVNLQIGKLNKVEANIWRQANGLEVDTRDNEVVLADLYAEIATSKQVTNNESDRVKNPVGFSTGGYA